MAVADYAQERHEQGERASEHRAFALEDLSTVMDDDGRVSAIVHALLAVEARLDELICRAG